MCALGNPWKKASCKRAATRERGTWKARKPTDLEAVWTDLCLEGHVGCVRACVYSTQSHRKLEDGTVTSLSTSHVLPLNWSQSTDRAIADRSPSSPAGSQGGRSMLPWLSLLAGS